MALYDAEIRYTDDWIARLYARFEEWGIANDVILLVTADHGEEFMEHGNRGHHLTLYQEVMHVPMLLHAPGLAPAGLRVPGSVSIADVAPTLLDLAGLPGWPERSGRRTRPMLTEPGSGHTVRMDLLRPTKRIELLGWREGQDKLIYDTPGKLASIFDLSTDPHERTPRNFQDLNDPDAILRRAIEALRAEPQRFPYPPPDVSEPAHVTSALNQAGYVGD